EVALSIWLFYLVYRAEQVGYASMGLSGAQGARLFSPTEFIHNQEAGGFLMLAAALLWQSRGALRRAFAFRGLGVGGWGAERQRQQGTLSLRSQPTPDPRPPTPDDEAETPRWPLWGFVASNVGLALWARAAGAQVWAFLLIMLVYYVVALVITRLVAAGGV